MLVTTVRSRRSSITGDRSCDGRDRRRRSGLLGSARRGGRKPEPDDLILPLPPAAVEARRHRIGEPIRSGDYAGKKWREVDLPMLGWRHRRMYDGKATMITLAIDDGASRDIIKNRVTHARPVEDAFDHYYRGTQWLETCAELSKLRISRQPARGKLVAL